MKCQSLVIINLLSVEFFNKVVKANLPLNCQSQQLSSALSSACDFKSHFLQTVWTQIRLLL